MIQQRLDGRSIRMMIHQYETDERETKKLTTTKSNEEEGRNKRKEIGTIQYTYIKKENDTLLYSMRFLSLWFVWTATQRLVRLMTP
jgi:hypothetical protein